MTSPETLELEAVDAALAGRYVAPEHAELADLALLLRDERPEPSAAWVNELDRRVRTGFPARPKPPRRQWVWLRKAAPVMAIFAIVIPVGFGLSTIETGGDDDSGGGGGASTASEAPSSADEGSAGSGEAAQDSAGATEQPRSATPLSSDARPRSVERSVTITLGTSRRQVDRVATEIGDVTADLGGYVARSSISSSGGGDLQLRIPTRRLDTAIQRLSKLAKVTDLSRSSQDITAAVVSARDQLQDARAERKALLTQLATATTINETESIRARLRIVSNEIAAARNTLRRRTNRANFADVAVTLGIARGEDNDDEGGAWTPGDAFHDALRVLEVIAGVAVIAAAIAIPLLVAWLLGWMARRGVTRRRRERALDIA
jgi:hypothetical protein